MWKRPSTASNAHRLLALAATLVLGAPGPSPSAIALAASPRRSSASAPEAADALLGDALVGTTPPEWTLEAWASSPPLTLSRLRGQVVLVRWLMSPQCPHCWSTAASLRRLHKAYAACGLVVVAIYHHNDDAPLTEERYQAHLRDFGFAFPIARDLPTARGWKTLDAWWLAGRDRDYSSPSFLLDRAGRVRGVHPGGSIVPGDAAYESLRRGIEHLLREPAEPAAHASVESDG